MDFNKAFEEIIELLEAYYPNLNNRQRKKLKDAFLFAEQWHDGQERSSGEPYFTHPLAATKILMSIKPDIDTICACLMHDVIEDTPATAQDVEDKFGPEVRSLCEGVEKVAKIRIVAKEQDEKKFENIQKLFVAMAKDIRVIFVKLADRIHNLQTLEYVRPEKQGRIARESLEIYAPVADKLGLHDFKSQIERACFKVIYPQGYRKIVKQVEVTKKIRQKFIDKAKKEILKKFNAENFKVESIQAREKDLYSLFKKMRRKGAENIDDIYDFLGVRIIVANKGDCYRVLGILHSAWRPMPKRFKDYIAVPKPNGYQSLHTTVLGLGQNSLPTEVQIRTSQMHMDAQYGPAAHWAYKKRGDSNFDEDYIRKTSWLSRRISAKEDTNAADFFREIFDSAFSERIFVFTPKGELKFFPIGATPIDFAYSIHSDIGESCVGAKVNGVIKPLNYKLKNGDVLNILTKKGRRPNPTWLNFVKTSSAREKIRNVLRKDSVETLPQENLQEIRKPDIIDEKLRKLDEPKKDLRRRTAKQIIIGDEVNMAYRMASCCKPKKTDPIIAYKNLGKDFSVHRQDCEELVNLDPERFYEAYYLLEKKLKMIVSDGYGVLLKVTTIMSHHHIGIYSVRTKSDHKNQTAALNFVLHVHSEKEYRELLQDLEKTPYYVDFEKK